MRTHRGSGIPEWLSSAWPSRIQPPQHETGIPSPPTKSGTFEELVDKLVWAAHAWYISDPDAVAAVSSALVSAYNELEAEKESWRIASGQNEEAALALRSRIAGLEEQYYELQQMASEEVSALRATR